MKKRKLKKLLKAAIAAQQQAQTPAPEQAGPTLNEWLDVHEREMRCAGHKPQTIRNRTATINHCRRLWGTRPIRALKAHEIAEGLRSFPPNRSSTAGRVRGELCKAFDEAIANDWADRNPVTPVKAPKHRVKRKRLKLEVWKAMYELSKQSRQRWLPCLLLLGLVTGQRRSDLVKMTFDDIITDADGQQYLRIEQAEKAGKLIGARVEIPLALRLDAIGFTVGEVIDLCRACGKPGPTLIRKAGGGKFEESSLSTRFHELIVAVLGPDAHAEHEWPSLHELRSLASRLFKDQGEDVQTLLGHKHAAMTAVYTDDRGSDGEKWKRVVAAVREPIPAVTSANDAGRQEAANEPGQQAIAA